MQNAPSVLNAGGGGELSRTALVIAYAKTTWSYLPYLIIEFRVWAILYRNIRSLINASERPLVFAAFIMPSRDGIS